VSEDNFDETGYHLRRKHWKQGEEMAAQVVSSKKMVQKEQIAF
jgi:hypothetical protein